MKIRIVAIGKIKENSIRESVEEYLKRLGKKVEIIELKDESLEKEATRLEKYIDDNTFVLDVEGKEMSSKEFSELFDKDITFLIGGAYGISDTVKNKCKTISLSKMTFTHEMCRLFLLEQIYRADMIRNNRKYHK